MNKKIIILKIKSHLSDPKSPSFPSYSWSPPRDLALTLLWQLQRRPSPSTLWQLPRCPRHSQGQSRGRPAWRAKPANIIRIKDWIKNFKNNYNLSDKQKSSRLLVFFAGVRQLIKNICTVIHNYDLIKLICKCNYGAAIKPFERMQTLFLCFPNCSAHN